jgi:phosphonoacetate hydrolase
MVGQDVVVNGRIYSWPKAPVVVVCVDGCEPAYLTEAMKDGAMPWLSQAIKHGANMIGDSVVPTFTNPNNLSIVTGALPSVHGICGNYLFDRDSGEEVMMNDPKFLRSGTILAAFANVGAKVAVVTAKDKLRKLLGHRMRGICFSAEKANETTKAENGIDDALGFVGMELPSVYSAALSEFVMAAGVKLLREKRADIIYLSTTDYIQHKHAPGAAPANQFYMMLDRYLGELDALGAIVVLTADHGMNAKHDAAGAPNVIYLQDLLDEWLGKRVSRVILPITDPYVVHHGALGSFATVYLQSEGQTASVAKRIGGLDGVLQVIARDEASRKFGLPADRIGDLVIIATQDHVIGTSASRHDLSGLTQPLRSHGGLSEQKVPVILNRRLRTLPKDYHLRNFSAFDLALNYAIEYATRGLDKAV